MKIALRFVGLCLVVIGASVAIVSTVCAVFIAVILTLEDNHQIVTIFTKRPIIWTTPVLLAGYAFAGLLVVGVGVWIETKSRAKAE